MNKATLVPSSYRFSTAEAWLENHRQLVRMGEAPIPPSTREELMLAERSGVLRRDWVPRKTELKFLGLPEDFGEPPEVMDRREKRRLLQTLSTDHKFRKIFCGVIAESLKEVLHG